MEITPNILQNQSQWFQKKEVTGKRLKCRYTEGKGHHIRAQKLKRQKTRNIDFAATLRAAAPFQRKGQDNHWAMPSNLPIKCKQIISNPMI